MQNNPEFTAVVTGGQSGVSRAWVEGRLQESGPNANVYFGRDAIRSASGGCRGIKWSEDYGP